MDGSQQENGVNDRDEWRADVRGMSEQARELAIDEPRRALGLTGDREDARD